MNTTSRRDFITGLATASAALPIAASTHSIEETKHQETWDDVKARLKIVYSRNQELS